MKVTVLHIRGHAMYQIPTSNLAITYAYMNSIIIMQFRHRQHHNESVPSICTINQSYAVLHEFT